jgi:hypothetical protein
MNHMMHQMTQLDQSWIDAPSSYWLPESSLTYSLADTMYRDPTEASVLQETPELIREVGVFVSVAGHKTCQFNFVAPTCPRVQASDEATRLTSVFLADEKALPSVLPTGRHLPTDRSEASYFRDSINTTFMFAQRETLDIATLMLNGTLTPVVPGTREIDSTTESCQNGVHLFLGPGAGDGLAIRGNITVKELAVRMDSHTWTS